MFAVYFQMCKKGIVNLFTNKRLTKISFPLLLCVCVKVSYLDPREMSVCINLLLGDTVTMLLVIGCVVQLADSRLAIYKYDT